MRAALGPPDCVKGGSAVYSDRENGVLFEIRMSTEMWILMVGLRVVDLGALAVWLLWFHRQTSTDDEGSDGGDFVRSTDPMPDEPPAPTGGDDLDLPLPDALPWPSRRRDHSDDDWPPAKPVRRQPEPHREPVRVSRPA